MIHKLDKNLDSNREFSMVVDLLNQNINEESDQVELLEKMLIILLVTKLETFLENKTSEWFEYMKSNPMNTVNNISQVIKKEIIKDTYRICKELEDGVVSNKNKNKIKNFNILIDELYPLSNLDIDFKLTLNSHGSNEIKGLLRKIGLENIFETIEENVEKGNEVLEGIHLTAKMDYEGIINKLINYRNSIIHEDYLNYISISDINEFIESVNLIGNVVFNYVKQFELEKDVIME